MPPFHGGYSTIQWWIFNHSFVNLRDYNVAFILIGGGQGRLKPSQGEAHMA
jgi:hypothetical protein